jgi:site-specific recombinase XerD
MNKSITWVDYYTYLEHKGLSPTTIASHRSSINRFILWIKQKKLTWWAVKN